MSDNNNSVLRAIMLDQLGSADKGIEEFGLQTLSNGRIATQSTTRIGGLVGEASRATDKSTCAN